MVGIRRLHNGPTTGDECKHFISFLVWRLDTSSNILQREFYLLYTMSERLPVSESGGEVAVTIVNNIISDVVSDGNYSESKAETKWDTPSLLLAFDTSEVSDVVMTFFKDQQLFASKAVLASFSRFFHNLFLWNQHLQPNGRYLQIFLNLLCVYEINSRLE